MPKGFQPGNQEAKKKGKHKKTLEKMRVLEALRQGVMREVEPVLRSSLDSARGLTMMYQRKKVKNKKGKYKRTGEFVMVKDPDRITELLNGNCEGEDWYYITTKDPNIVAVRELWDRAFGKPEQPVKHSGDSSNPVKVDVAIVEEVLEKAYGQRTKKTTI